MEFQGIQKTFTYTQINNGSIDEVFSLLCPVREKDWIDGWDYRMIHSKSGLIEKDCVFTTPHHGDQDTVWQVTQYDPKKCRLEFVRVTPSENIVRINIHLESIDPEKTRAFICYKYTALNEEQNMVLVNQMGKSFNQSMNIWESSINHYLKHREKLILEK